MRSRIAELVPFVGPTAAALVFLTTFRAGELRALLDDERSRRSHYLREALFSTTLPPLTLALFAFMVDPALDCLDVLFGREGFMAAEATFVLLTVLILSVAVYQAFMAKWAWSEWRQKT